MGVSKEKAKALTLKQVKYNKTAFQINNFYKIKVIMEWVLLLFETMSPADLWRME